MKIRLGDLKQLLVETGWRSEETGWSVKPGQVLVRGVMEPPAAWRWDFLPERMIFKREELKHAPSSPTSRQVWVFERNGLLYGIAEYDFYVAPRRAWE